MLQVGIKCIGISKDSVSVHVPASFTLHPPSLQEIKGVKL